MKHSTLLFCASFCFVVLCAFLHTTSAQPSSNTVMSKLGPIRGYLAVDGSGYVYRAVPYANNNGRFQHSTVIEKPYSGLIDNKNDGTAFPQICKLPDLACPTTFSEDSYTLNVFTPTFSPPNATKPTMVFFHGGNYFQGSGAGPLYNATRVAALGDVVIVSINYRLGILGFFRDPSRGIYGNYGLVDQVNALKWVRANIAAFGGNPDNVTIFGQSAGGSSVAAHLISPYSRGLFHKAISHSNPVGIPFRTLTTVAGLAKAFYKHANICSTRDCIDQMPVDALLAAQEQTATDLEMAEGGTLLSVFMPFVPYVEATDGKEPTDPQYPHLIPGQFLEAFALGKVPNIPIMLGMVSMESDLFIEEAFTTPLDDFMYGVLGLLIFGEEKSKKIISRYPAEKGSDHRRQLKTIGTEFIFHCPSRNITRSMIQSSVAPQHVYSYVFDYLMSFNDDLWGDDGHGHSFPVCTKTAEHDAAVCHAADIVTFFNSAHWKYPYTTTDLYMTNQMDIYWTNFARTGSPNNGPNTPTTTWGSFSATSGDGHMRFSRSGKTEMINGYLKDACDWWDKNIGYRF